MKYIFLCCIALMLAGAPSFAQTPDAAAPAAPAAVPVATPAPAAAPAPVAAPATTPATTAAKPGGLAPIPNPLDPQPDPPMPAGSKPDWMGFGEGYSGEQSDLTNPHRTPEEIVAWVQSRAADFLTFTSTDQISLLKSDGITDLPEDANTKLGRIKPLFSQQGWAEYATYMRDKKVIDMVRQQGYSVTTIMNGTGSVIEKGPAAGSYHWLVKSPLMMSLTKVGDEGGEKTLRSGNYDLVMQVGRIPQENVEADGLVIEGWKMTEKEDAPSTNP